MSVFAGTWVGPDEYTAEVEYTVSLADGRVLVTAIDPSDGEVAEVFDIDSGPGLLAFRTRWPSTGRECACTFRLLSGDRVELTFTYTDRALLARKPSS